MALKLDEPDAPAATTTTGGLKLDDYGDPPPPGSGSGIVDWFNALGTGANRALIANTIGLPMDTARNVVDLGKAAAGSPWLLAGKTPPQMLQVESREDVPLTSAWIQKRARETQTGRAALDPVNPEYEGSYTQNAGGAIASLLPYSRKMTPLAAPVGKDSSMALNAIGNLSRQAAGNILAASAGKAVGDATGNEALAIAAGMSPSLIRPGLVEGSRRYARGGIKGIATSGEADRQRVAERIKLLEDAGAGDGLTIGLATGNKTIGGLENILYNTFGASGVMNANKERLNLGMQARTNEIGDTAAGGRSTAPFRTGEAIQGDLTDWRAQFKENLKDRAYKNVDALIPPDTKTDLTNTRRTLADVNAVIPDFEATSKRLLNQELVGLGHDLTRDLSRTTPGAPPGQMVTRTIRPGGGIMNAPIEEVKITPTPGGSPTTTVGDTGPFVGVRKIRTMIGDKLSDNPMNPATIPASKLSPTYAALSKDMEAQAALLDAQRRAARQAGINGLPSGEKSESAARALEIQQRYYRQGSNRLETLNPLTADKVTAEGALARYTDMAAKSGGDLTGLAAAKASLTPGTRGQVAGNVIKKLGEAMPGQQDAAGNAWSSERFLTNWNKMSPEGRDQLFTGFKDADRVKQEVENAAKVSAMLRENSKMWANPSGTAGAQATRSAFYGLGAGGLGLLTGSAPFALAAATSPVVSAYGAAKLVTNPGIVRAVAKKTGVDPNTLLQRFAALRGTGLLDEQKPQPKLLLDQ